MSSEAMMSKKKNDESDDDANDANTTKNTSSAASVDALADKVNDVAIAGKDDDGEQQQQHRAAASGKVEDDDDEDDRGGVEGSANSNEDDEGVVGDSKRTIFIGGVPPYDIDEEKVTRYFKTEHEEDVSTKLIPDARKGCHKGYGFVKFKTQASAERFLALGKVEIDGKTIDVKAANKDSPRYDLNHSNNMNTMNMMMMMNPGVNGGGFYNNNHHQRGGGFSQQGYPNQMMMGGGRGRGRGFMGGGRGDFGGGRGGRGVGYMSHYGQTHGYHQPNIIMGPDGNMMVVDPYFNPNMGVGGVGANQGMFTHPRPRRFSGGRGGGFMGQRRGTYPAQFNQSGNANGLNGSDGVVNGPSQSDGNDGIVNNPDEEDSEDANGNATNASTGASGGSNEAIPLLDENGFPLPAEEQGTDQDRAVGGASSSTSSRRYNSNGAGGMGGGYPQNSSQVFVGGLPKTATEEEVGWFFSQYGPVARVRLIYDKETGASKRYGFVEFAHPEIAATVKDLRNLQFQGRTIDVNFASRHISQMNYGMPPRGSRHQQHQQVMMQQMMAAGGMPPPFDAMGNPIMYAPNGMMIPPPYFAAMQQQNDGGENMKTGGDDGNTSISNIGGVDMSSFNANMNAGGMPGGANLEGQEYLNMYGAPYGMGFPPGNAAMFGQPGAIPPDGSFNNMDPSGMMPIPQQQGQPQQQDFSPPLPQTGMSESVVSDE